MINVLWVFLAYLLGSIPFGLILGFTVKRVDIRELGSQNIGATNVFRVVGKKWGILVLLLDALKGYLACFVPTFIGDYPSTVPLQLCLGIAAIFGHSFPVWLRFKGGKGVATSLGVFLAIAWVPTLITFGIWILCFVVSKIISVSSLIAAVVFPLIISWYFWNTSDLYFLLPISLVLAVFIFYTHRTNIQRLRQKTERKLF